jgi:hypothetical protein
MRTRARRRSAISALRTRLYWLARVLGDVQAVRRGPEAVGKRLMRRAAGKMMGRLLGIQLATTSFTSVGNEADLIQRRELLAAPRI